VGGMSCVNCSNAVINKVKSSFGSALVDIQITLLTGKMRCTFTSECIESGEVSQDKVCKAVKEGGKSCDFLGMQ
jgi:copper chaperone CopZ